MKTLTMRRNVNYWSWKVNTKSSLLQDPGGATYLNTDFRCKVCCLNRATVDQYRSYYGVKSRNRSKRWIRMAFWEFIIRHMLIPWQLHKDKLIFICVDSRQVNKHSVEQKSIGLIFRTSRLGSHLAYSCHHNSSPFTCPIFVHSWRPSIIHPSQSITPRNINRRQQYICLICN